MQKSPPVPLNYAPVKPNWWKRAFRIFLVLVVLCFTFATWRWGPYAWHQSQILYWQNQCMKFTAPPDKIMYEEDPGQAAKLLQDPEYKPFVLRLGGIVYKDPTSVQAAFLEPTCWKVFQALCPMPVNEFDAGMSRGVGTVIFLHELTSPSGRRKLVCVTHVPGFFTRVFISGMNYDSYVADPATWGLPPKPGSQGYNFSGIGNWASAPPRMRIYAGQIDPKDPSHFTVRYQMWGQEDVLDGRLLDNDDVTLTARHVPKEPGK